jgi:hypothetical protein
MNFLPDSRSRSRTGAIPSVLGTQIPVYCANCGVSWGMVREEDMTFAFVLCQACADKYGDIVHTYSEPDAVFWARAQEAQLEEHQRLLTLEELLKELDDSSTVMSGLADEWLAHARKDL